MADLEKQVGRVLRRLNIQHFVNCLVWSWALTLLAAGGWVFAQRIWPVLPGSTAQAVGLSLGVGLFASFVVWLFTRRKAVDAALMLDRAFGLKERISTALTLSDDLRGTSAGSALMTDASKRVRDLDVSEKFGFQVPKFAWLPIPSAALLALIVFFVPFGLFTDSGSVEAKTKVSAKERKQVENSTKVLAKRLKQHQRLAEKQGMTDAKDLLKDLIEKAEKDAGEDKAINRKQALAKLHNIQDSIKERREKLGGTEQLQKQLAKLQETSERGPADSFQEALKSGDFKKALKSIQDVMEKMKSGTLDKEQQKKLEKQLGEIANQLKKLADLQEKKKQLMEAGLSEEALKKELKKLAQQAKQLKAMEKLAEKLGECQKCMSEGDMKEAMNQLGLSQEDLEQMAAELEELGMLEDALNDLAQMRNAMTCQNCNGLGCSMCQGMNGMNNGNQGQGMGSGRGTGPRNEREDRTRSFTARTPQQLQAGKIQIKGFVKGQQFRGESQLDEQELIVAGAAASSDALTKERIPKDYKDHAKEYLSKVGDTDRGSDE